MKKHLQKVSFHDHPLMMTYWLNLIWQIKWMIYGARAGDVRRREDMLQTAQYLVPKCVYKKTTNIDSDVRGSQDTRIHRADNVGRIPED